MNDRVIPAGLDPNSDQYKAIVAELLERIDPYKGLGTPLYKAIAARSWNVYFEGIAIRKSVGGKLQVYLARRDETDPDWQGFWHAPSSAFRAGESEKDPARRVAKEFGAAEIGFNYVGEYSTWARPTEMERGSGISRIYLVDLWGCEPAVNNRRNWFDVDKLPVPTVGAHKGVFIPRAVEAFWASQRMKK